MQEKADHHIPRLAPPLKTTTLQIYGKKANIPPSKNALGLITSVFLKYDVNSEKRQLFIPSKNQVIAVCKIFKVNG